MSVASKRARRVKRRAADERARRLRSFCDLAVRTGVMMVGPGTSEAQRAELGARFGIQVVEHPMLGRDAITGSLVADALRPPRPIDYVPLPPRMSDLEFAAPVGSLGLRFLWPRVRL